MFPDVKLLPPCFPPSPQQDSCLQGGATLNDSPASFTQPVVPQEIATMPSEPGIVGLDTPSWGQMDGKVSGDKEKAKAVFLPYDGFACRYDVSSNPFFMKNVCDAPRGLSRWDQRYSPPGNVAVSV